MQYFREFPIVLLRIHSTACPLICIYTLYIIRIFKKKSDIELRHVIGALPCINQRIVDMGIRTALGLGSSINTYSRFDRKHYHYCDIPLGYQITQQFSPIAVGGKVNVRVKGRGAEGSTEQDMYTKEVEITRIQIEQDTGKSLHNHHPYYTLVDLNRAGVALVEIISEPQMRCVDSNGGPIIIRIPFSLFIPITRDFDIYLISTGIHLYHYLHFSVPSYLVQGLTHPLEQKQRRSGGVLLDHSVYLEILG